MHRIVNRSGRAGTLAAALVAVAAAVVTVGSAGCGGKLSLVAHTAATTNAGRPFYAVVRAVDRKTYLAEDYDTVAGKALDASDPSLLDSSVVYPGLDWRSVVKIPDKLGVAVYFLFTDPAGDWQLLFESPVPSSAELVLEGDRINPNVKRQPPADAKLPKVEVPKEAPKVEAPKAEAPKVEAPKVETPKASK